MPVSHIALRAEPTEIDFELYYMESIAAGRRFESNYDSGILVETTGKSKLSCELLPGNGYRHEVVFISDIFDREGQKMFIDLSVYREVDAPAVLAEITV